MIDMDSGEQFELGHHAMDEESEAAERSVQPMSPRMLELGLEGLDNIYAALEALSTERANAVGGPWEQEFKMLHEVAEAIGRKHEANRR